MLAIPDCSGHPLPAYDLSVAIYINFCAPSWLEAFLPGSCILLDVSPYLPRQVSLHGPVGGKHYDTRKVRLLFPRHTFGGSVPSANLRRRGKDPLRWAKPHSADETPTRIACVSH